MKVKLIEDWKQSWKWSSVRLAALGALASSLITAFPDAMIHAWALMPTEWREAMQVHAPAIAGVFFCLAIVLRLKKDGKP
jgi:hypothetical protein